jgi:hypothetical protein
MAARAQCLHVARLVSPAIAESERVIDADVAGRVPLPTALTPRTPCPVHCLTQCLPCAVAGSPPVPASTLRAVGGPGYVDHPGAGHARCLRHGATPPAFRASHLIHRQATEALTRGNRTKRDTVTQLLPAMAARGSRGTFRHLAESLVCAGQMRCHRPLRATEVTVWRVSRVSPLNIRGRWLIWGVTRFRVKTSPGSRNRGVCAAQIG